MEPLYTKLYEKYCKLKKKKLSETNDINKEQEEKFLCYVAAAEDLIQHLQNEKEELLALVEDLRKEVITVRASKDKKCTEYHELLLEENHKNRALSEEIERLRLQLREGFTSNLGAGKDMLLKPDKSIHTATGENGGTTKKRHRPSEGCVDEGALVCGFSDKQNEIPECCRRTVNVSGTDQEPSEPRVCVFQAVIENLLGLKLAVVTKIEGICVTAIHMSSGYSFSLSWVHGACGESELLYNVLSLGTLERVAPEWMKDAAMFSTSMCPIFFERVSRVIKLM